MFCILIIDGAKRRTGNVAARWESWKVKTKNNCKHKFT